MAGLLVEILRGGQPDAVKKDLGEIDRRGASAGLSVQQLNKVLGAVGVGLSAAAVGRFLKATVAEAIDAERALDNLAISVENTGTSFQAVQAAMDGAANDLQRLTRFGDDTARDAMAALTRITGDASKAMGLLGITADVAAATQMDLVSAAERVGRMLNGETAVLKRYGIVIGENEDALTGLRRVVGGFAETEAQGLGVQLQQVRNAFNDVLEAIGKAIIGGSEFRTVTQSLKTALEDMEEWVYRNQNAIAAWVQVLVQSINLAIQVLDLFATTVVNTFKTVGDLLGNLGALVLGLLTYKNDPTGAVVLISTAIAELKRNVVDDTQAIRDALVETAATFVKLGESIGVAAAGGVPAGPPRRPGRGAPVAQAPGRSPWDVPLGDPKEMIAQALAANEIWLTMHEDQLQQVLDRIAADLGLVTQQTIAMVNEAASTIESGLEQTLGDAIFNGLSAAFETGSLLKFFESFGKTLLAGFGDIMVQLGRVLIAYGLTMEKLRPWLMNVFTAGPAAIAAGAALIALGSAFTKIVSGGGGVGRGTASAGAFREPTFGGAQASITTRSLMTPGTGGAVAAQPAQVFNFTVIGEHDPAAQRQIQNLVKNARGRGIGG